MQAASYLVYACDHLNKPHEVIAKAFGDNFADLAMETTKLVRVQRMARLAQQSASHCGHAHSHGANRRRADRERAQDAAGVLARFARGDAAPGLASADPAPLCRHQSCRCRRVLAAEALQVFAPLANRLGIWEVKWEIEDLSFRFLEPDTYRRWPSCWTKNAWSARPMWSNCAQQLAADLAAQGIHAKVQGRPKHIYSIVKKMRGKSLGFDQVYDIRALRIVVPNVPDCYAALSWCTANLCR